MSPEDAIKPENYQKVYDALYNRPKRKTPKQRRKDQAAVFQVGDKVRNSLHN